MVLDEMNNVTLVASNSRNALDVPATAASHSDANDGHCRSSGTANGRSSRFLCCCYILVRSSK